jgi:hypothetical protein
MAIGVLGPGIGNESVPAIDPGMGSGGHLGLHAVQVCQGVQTTGVYKTLGCCGLSTKQPPEQQWEEKNFFHTEVFCGFDFLILVKKMVRRKTIAIAVTAYELLPSGVFVIRNPFRVNS